MEQRERSVGAGAGVWEKDDAGACQEGGSDVGRGVDQVRNNVRGCGG